MLDSTRDGEEPKATPLPLANVAADLLKKTDGELRRVEQNLFTHAASDPDVDWLTSPPALFGWIQHRLGVIEWRRGTGFVNREEFYCQVQRIAPACKAVELLPHWPPIPGHYYACGTPPAGDGAALAGLLHLYCWASEIDAELAMAMYATGAWGGSAGQRPAFMLTALGGRGRGKSRAAQHLARCFGGYVDISAQEEIGNIKSRLLSPDAQCKRFALLDNLKSLRFSWAELESLITSDVVSGPRSTSATPAADLLTWLVTLERRQSFEPTWPGGWWKFSFRTQRMTKPGRTERRPTSTPTASGL